jgi:hypothetical protein
LSNDDYIEVSEKEIAVVTEVTFAVEILARGVLF